MASFCMYCGRQLADGEVCNCQQTQAQSESQPQNPEQSGAQAGQSYNQAPPQTGQPYNQVPPQAQAGQPYYQAPPRPSYTGQYIQTYFSCIGKLLLKPADGARELVEKGHFAISLVLLFLQALLTGFFSLVITGYQLEMDGGDCAKYFFLFLFLSLLLSGATYGTAVIAGFCTSGKPNAKMLLNAIALRSIVAIPFTFIGLFLAFPLMGFGVGLFFFCEIPGLVYQIFGLQAAYKSDDNKASYIALILCTVYIIIFAICARLVAEDFVNTVMYSMMRSIR